MAKMTSQILKLVDYMKTQNCNYLEEETLFFLWIKKLNLYQQKGRKKKQFLNVCCCNHWKIHLTFQIDKLFNCWFNLRDLKIIECSLFVTAYSIEHNSKYLTADISVSGYVAVSYCYIEYWCNENCTGVSKFDFR